MRLRPRACSSCRSTSSSAAVRAPPLVCDVRRADARAVYCTSLLVTLTTREFVLGAGPSAAGTTGAFTSVLDPPQLFSAGAEGSVGVTLSLQDMGSAAGKAPRGATDSV
jgi:hypothetical protein